MKSAKISRREFLKRATLLGGGVVAAGFAGRGLYNHLGRNFQPARARAYLDGIQASPAPRSLPNIIIILCDDLGFGDLASPAIAVPNIKRLAAGGTSLPNFYATASVCSPSRAGLLTGRYPVRTLISTPLLSTNNPLNVVMDVLGRYSYDVQGIPKDEVLLPEVLHRRGYRTGLVGKWHLGGTPGYLPNDRGFDSFYGALWSNDDTPYAIYRNRQVAIPAPADEDFLTHDFTLAALDFIRTSQDQPFFLYLAHAMPHFPEHASAAFQGKSGAGLYGDAVEELDWSVGQLLDTLDQLGLAENTLVIFSSDNGPWMQGNPGFLRGRKLLCFEGGFRVPFIACWPGVIPAGTTNPEMVVNFDLFATCLQLAGASLPNDRLIDGRDVLPVLIGKAPSPHDSFFYYDTRRLVAVRQQHWKYCREYTTDNAAYWPTTQGPFLFDLDTDPNESYSLLEEQPQRAADMAAMLNVFEKNMKANLRGWL
jgi:uncharacterized sulfatase